MAALVRWNGAPGEDREAEVDGGRVEGIDGVVELEAEAVLGIERPGDADQRLGEVGMDAPVAPLVGVGQGGAGDAPADAHVVELGVLGAQAGLDVAQALAIGQLRERPCTDTDRGRRSFAACDRRRSGGRNGASCARADGRSPGRKRSCLHT